MDTIDLSPTRIRARGRIAVIVVIVALVLITYAQLFDH